MAADGFRERLATIRKYRGYSQEGLARRADMSTGSVYRMEAGHTLPGLYGFMKLALALEVSLDELAGVDDLPPTLQEAPAIQEAPALQTA